MNSYRRRFLIFAAVASIGILVVQNLHAQNGGTAVQEMEKVVPSEFTGDLRTLPRAPVAAAAAQRPYRPRFQPPQGPKSGGIEAPRTALPTVIAPQAPMPATSQSFSGLNFSDICGGSQCGSGWPPDTNGAVGTN